MPFVVDRNKNLSEKGNTTQRKLNTQGFLINRFQESRPQHSMNFNRGANDSTGQLI